MSIFAELRMLGLLRRLVRAVESIASSQVVLARSANAEWNRRHRMPTSTPALELAEMDLAAIEKDWNAQQASKFIDESPDRDR